jgi:uncharacterized protein YdhG (YjbR/CyaY superfamily)
MRVWKQFSNSKSEAHSTYEWVDAYIGAQPEPVQRVLSQVRSAIRKAVPQAEECISYGMPTFKVQSARLLFFAAWKRHYSLYPVTGTVLAAFQRELGPYKVDKSTLRFPLLEPVPVDLIERIAQFRASEL